MRVGVWLPNAMPFGLERGFFLDWVRLADEAGFDTLSTVDRPNYDLWDPLTSLAAAAAVTQRIRLATTTLPLPNRNEVLVAKQAAVIDRVSGGRLTLGVSLGSRPDDYEVFGATLAHRVTRFRRQLATIQRVWAEARHSDREHGVLGPPPVQDPGRRSGSARSPSGLGSGPSSSPTGSSSVAPPDPPRSDRRSRACARRLLRAASPTSASTRSPTSPSAGSGSWPRRSPITSATTRSCRCRPSRPSTTVPSTRSRTPLPSTRPVASTCWCWAWAATPWAVVTATGIVQARCGQPTPAGACGAWRLSAPGGERWKPCYACGSVEAPVAVQAAGPDVAAAVAQARKAAAPPP
jgi:hypothetical protein